MFFTYWIQCLFGRFKLYLKKSTNFSGRGAIFSIKCFFVRDAIFPSNFFSRGVRFFPKFVFAWGAVFFLKLFLWKVRFFMFKFSLLFKVLKSKTYYKSFRIWINHSLWMLLSDKFLRWIVNQNETFWRWLFLRYCKNENSAANFWARPIGETRDSSSQNSVYLGDLNCTSDNFLRCLRYLKNRISKNYLFWGTIVP